MSEIDDLAAAVPDARLFGRDTASSRHPTQKMVEGGKRGHALVSERAREAARLRHAITAVQHPITLRRFSWEEP